MCNYQTYPPLKLIIMSQRTFVRDLPKNANLKGLKLRTKTGVIGYYFSSTEALVFFNNIPEDRVHEGRLYPQVLAKPDIILGWEVINDDNISVNCDKLTDLKYIINEL